jgi:hypothetical protein
MILRCLAFLDAPRRSAPSDVLKNVTSIEDAVNTYDIGNVWFFLTPLAGLHRPPLRPDRFDGCGGRRERPAVAGRRAGVGLGCTGRFTPAALAARQQARAGDRPGE